jgi:hypothetical protein
VLGLALYVGKIKKLVKIVIHIKSFRGVKGVNNPLRKL